MAELPKQELLIKLLGMTQSDHDGEAVAAIRKANSLLAAAGWTWEQLIRGKITVVEDPFNNLTSNPWEEIAKKTYAAAPTAPPRAPTPPPQPRRTFAQNIPFVASNSRQIGTIPNKFVGYCYCCGVEVPATTGRAFTPDKYNPAAPSKWSVICIPCTTSGTVYANATGQRPRKRGKADISSLI